MGLLNGHSLTEHPGNSFLFMPLCCLAVVFIIEVRPTWMFMDLLNNRWADKLGGPPQINHQKQAAIICPQSSSVTLVSYDSAKI